jgi:restriction endonuclease Mrr
MKSAHDLLKSTLPHRETLIQEIVRVLEDSPAPLGANQMDSIVARNLEITEEQLSLIRSGVRSEFSYSMAWARTMAKSRGLIHQPSRRVWALHAETSSHSNLSVHDEKISK